jgi:quercetin dioxygenase-like cupin family protein
VWKPDWLGRSLKDLLEIVTALEQRGIGFKSLQESMDTTTPGGKLIFHVFAALAEFERGVIRERTQAGLNAARAQRWQAAQAVSERRGIGGHLAERPQQPRRRYLRDGRHFARHALPVRQGREGSDQERCIGQRLQPVGVRTRQGGTVMAINIRRVVTGHDANGKAVVRIDDVGAHVASGRPQMSRQLIWTTDDVPVHFTEDGEDKGARAIGTTIPHGSVFRVVEYAPGVTPRNHRTDSLDDAVVMSGEIDMEMDDTVVHLKAGDVLVQRGTIHNWANHGTAPWVIAFVLISSDGNTAVG